MHKNPWENDKFTELSLKNIDEKFSPKTKQQVDFLMYEMGLVKGCKILDLGCGAGRHSIEFAGRGVSVTGIDISPKMIEYAKGRTKSKLAQYIQCDISLVEELGFSDNSFDGAICLCESGIGVIGGENRDFDFFENIYRLLKPNAYFVISCFNSLRRYIRSGESNPNFDYINSTMTWILPEEVVGERLCEVQRQYAPSEIKLLLRLAGFKNIDVLSCKDGDFTKNPMNIDDIEMLVVAKK